jgi:hypothetical protein
LLPVQGRKIFLPCFAFRGMIAIRSEGNMDDKITIIEGPPPTFEAVNEGWVSGLNESPILAEIALTRLRTFNGPALVERCHRAWRNQQTIHLEFLTSEGLEHKAPIVAARAVETEDGHMLMLWVRLNEEEVKLEFGYDDDIGDEDDDFGYSE